MIDYRQNIAAYEVYLGKLLGSISIPLWDARAKGNIPSQSGIYRIFLEDRPDETLYVGKAEDLRKRLCGGLLAGNEQSHGLRKKLATSFDLPDKKAVTDFLERQCQCQIVVVKSIVDLSFVAHYAIAALRPSLNDEALGDPNSE